MSVCLIFFCWIELSLFANTRVGACDSSCNSLHASSFAVCGSFVKQVSHSWHIVLDTCALYTFLNYISLFISLLNLHLDSELINTPNENLYFVYRSLEIHNCALTSSPSPHPPVSSPPPNRCRWQHVVSVVAVLALSKGRSLSGGVTRQLDALAAAAGVRARIR